MMKKFEEMTPEERKEELRNLGVSMEGEGCFVEFADDAKQEKKDSFQKSFNELAANFGKQMGEGE